MKKLLAGLLTLALALGAFGGCAALESQLEGTWEGDADLAEAYESMLAKADADLASHIDLENFEVELTVNFGSNGNYRIEANEKQLKKGVTGLRKALGEGLASYLKKETGMDMDTYLAASSLTMDELLSRYFGTDLAATIKAGLESRGTWEVDDGELVLTDDKGNEVFRGEASVSGGKLKLKSGDADGLLGNLVPMTFKKK